MKTVDEIVPVYNLEIEDNHTYFAHGILVHNVTCLVARIPDGSYLVGTTDSKTKLADYTEGENGQSGDLYKVDGNALTNPSPKDAVPTLGFNPALSPDEQQYLREHGKLMNLVYEQDTGNLRKVINPDYTYVSEYTFLPPQYGEILATWRPAALYAGDKMEVLFGSIVIGATATIATSEIPPAAPFVGAAAAGTYSGARNNLIDQNRQIAQTIGWNSFQEVNSSEILINGGAGFLLGIATEGIFSVGGSFFSGSIFSRSAENLLESSTSNGGTGLVYQGFDKAGVVRYVGRTERDAAVRFTEHLDSETAKSLLRYEVIDGATGLSLTEARVWEQTLINKYGLQKNDGLLLNKINSIAQKNWWQHDIK